MRIDNGVVVQLAIEGDMPSLRCGAVVAARIIEKWVAKDNALARTEEGAEIYLPTLTDDVTEGASVLIEITREAFRERKGQSKRAMGRIADAMERDGPDLHRRIAQGDVPIIECNAHGEDYFTAFGWHEATEQAATGIVPFTGGELLIAPTAAMTVIDVDGTDDALSLSKNAAREVALALTRFQITGNVVIDFPSLPSKRDRTEITEIFDAHMTMDCERTAINGFGLMQVISRRSRQSFLDYIQRSAVSHIALQILRSAERSPGSGSMTITAHPAIIGKFNKNAQLIETLAMRTGRSILLEKNDGKAIAAFAIG